MYITQTYDILILYSINTLLLSFSILKRKAACFVSVMEALTSLSTKIFTRNSNRTLSSSKLTLLGRSDIDLSPSPKFLKKVHFDHLVLFRRTDPLLVTKSHVASDSEVLTGLETVVPKIQKFQSSKAVHVKFQLQKECMFGDQFLLVGDDPMIGLWNTSDAIPLNWSDGHIWSVELDVPIELTMQFKFILKRTTGEIVWQPGPDRIFKTWKSMSSIVVAEDWENPEAQKITEEQVIDQIEEPVTTPELEPVVATNVSHKREELLTNVSKDIMSPSNIGQAEDKPNGNNEFVTGDSNSYQGEGRLVNANKELKSEGYVGNRKLELMNKNNPRTLTGHSPVTDEDEETLGSNEGGPVLVPGLNPLHVSSEEELP